ncbi:hypothetical protein A3C17_03400 [Candidatus Uhrbacteria bacterium RIFCSPHIGHO2_02_FULL_53_13]|uniref:Methyltransferase type 11 domain-containing protein n=3 Tax=Candidatus Uhriibacteriota TaxID=1752732 RepID=A0A1F7TYD6_9BACT|nr:MAG: hypothetical protein A3C17_03400 [Candidatus Uhrbacteria bacterium RIFCSPHIGHO2_02_FULL_53_13]OGL89752.1 MAG: hypothetical protein A3I45_03995 [Candidatus Uhrbacteria bacterium RIFCSPLOWO2_02_FULL_53_10]
MNNNTDDMKEDRHTHDVRPCIYCGKDSAETLFTYTYDFLLHTRGLSPEKLQARGWDENTTSSIVKCRHCGCNYVRDIFIIYEQDSTKPLDEHERAELIEKYAKPITFEQANYLRYCRALADTLLRHFSKRTEKRSLSLLDFGSSLSSFSLTARVCGFHPVVLYDRYFRPNIEGVVSKQHPLDFHFIRDQQELRALAPFDVMTCQAAVEHFYDPQSELQLMHELLSDDGILFITNPCEPLNKKSELLKREGAITKSEMRRFLKKNYHLQHVNFPSPKQFSNMLARAGFQEKTTFLFYPFLDVPALGAMNILRMVKACLLFVLDLLKIPHKKKTAYFVVKR